MENTGIFYRYGIALVLGFLVGLQREYALNKEDKELSAGVRTFSLFSLIGCTAAHLSDVTGFVWIFVSILLLFGLLLAVNHIVLAWRNASGMTTEAAAIITMLTGALVYWNYIELAVALGVTTTILLSFKLELHKFARLLTSADIYSTLKFAVISVIILPILPNKTFGPEPFNLFNPWKIWLLVVFISGISFVGYILVKVIGAKKGISLTGLVGGLASSTAVTLSFTERSKSNQSLSKSFALAIIIAWTVMFARVLIAVAAINSKLLYLLWVPITISIISGLLYCLYLVLIGKNQKEKEQVSFSNPFELGPAIKFGLLFTVILFVSKAAQLYMGNAGVYLASIISGLADVDAIALSVARLSHTSSITEQIAVRAIVLAAAANTFTKGIIVMMGGSTELRKAILPGFILMLVTGVAAAFII